MCPGFETTFPSSPALNASSFFCCCFAGDLLSWGEVVQVERGSGDQEGTERSCSSQAGPCEWETLSTHKEPTKWGLDGPWRVTMLWEQGRLSQGSPAPKGTQLGCSEPPKVSEPLGSSSGAFISVMTLLHQLTPLGNGGSDGKAPFEQREIKPVP